MNETTSLMALADRMLWIAALVGAPVLLACLAVGLVIGIVQAATSVNEQTLAFIPKLIVVALCLALFGGAILTLLGDFMREMFQRIPELLR